MPPSPIVHRHQALLRQRVYQALHLFRQQRPDFVRPGSSHLHLLAPEVVEAFLLDVFAIVGGGPKGCSVVATTTWLLGHCPHADLEKALDACFPITQPVDRLAPSAAIFEYPVCQKMGPIDLLTWEHPFPESFLQLTPRPIARVPRVLTIAISNEELRLTAKPNVLGPRSAIQKEELVFRPGNHATANRAFEYYPDGRASGGVHYRLRIAGHLHATEGWQWMVELADTADLPHCYVKFCGPCRAHQEDS